MSTDIEERSFTEPLPEYLDRVLPDILANAGGPVTGTDIVAMIQGRDDFDWKENTVRFYLSCISKSGNGVVERTEERNADGRRKQGYVLRPEYARRWGRPAQDLAASVMHEARLLLIALKRDASDAPKYWGAIVEAGRNLDANLEALEREVGHQ